MIFMLLFLNEFLVLGDKKQLLMHFKGEMGSFKEIVFTSLGLTLQFPGISDPFPG